MALLGLFMMHGATASAAPSHCGGHSAVSHIHQSSLDELRQSTHVANPRLQTASLTPSMPAHSEDAGGICVAILIVGVLALLSHRAITTMEVRGSPRLRGTPSVFIARPPPAPRRSELSIWRN